VLSSVSASLGFYGSQVSLQVFLRGVPVSSPLEGAYGASSGEEAEVFLGVGGAAARLFEGEDLGFLYGPEVGVEGVLDAPGDEVD